MQKLQVYLFGSVRVTFEGAVHDLKLTRGVQNLLVFLLLNRQRMLSREMVAGVLWYERDQDNARKCLNTALWRLRQSLVLDESARESYLLTSNLGEIGFNPESDHWLDVDVFEKAIEFFQAKSWVEIAESQIDPLEKALSLYRGDLLEGNYEDWALREREHKRQEYINACQYLMSYNAYHGFYEHSLSFGQRILDLDPLREDIHRALMRIYQQSGRRAAALRQFEICRASLAEELGIPPMEETQTLYHQILNEPPKNPDLSQQTQETDLQRTLVQLQQVTRTLSQTQRELKQTLLMFKKDSSDHPS